MESRLPTTDGPAVLVARLANEFPSLSQETRLAYLFRGLSLPNRCLGAYIATRESVPHITVKKKHFCSGCCCQSSCITQSNALRTEAKTTKNMSLVCQFCSQACKTQRGLTQHINRTKTCKDQQDNLIGVSGGFCRPASTGTTNTTATATGGTWRRSSRIRKEARASECRVEVTDVDVGSLVAPEADDMESDADNNFSGANDSDMEASADDSEAESSELRDDLVDSNEETSENEADSRDSSSPSTDMLDNFIEYCFDHHTNPNNQLSEEDARSVNLMELLRKSKAPLSSYQPMLEWHLKETGHLKHWQTVKDSPYYVTRETLVKRLSKRYNCEAMKPKIKKVRLPFSKSVAHIPVRDAKHAILSLLTDPRIQEDDYLFFNDDPLSPPPVEVKHLEDLNTGDAYLKTFENMIE